MPAGSQSPHSTVTSWRLVSGMSDLEPRAVGEGGAGQPRHQLAVAAYHVDAKVRELRRARDLDRGRSQHLACLHRSIVDHVRIDAERRLPARVRGEAERCIGQGEGEAAMAGAEEVEMLG